MTVKMAMRVHVHFVDQRKATTSATAPAKKAVKCAALSQTSKMFNVSISDPVREESQKIAPAHAETASQAVNLSQVEFEFTIGLSCRGCFTMLRTCKVKSHACSELKV